MDRKIDQSSAWCLLIDGYLGQSSLLKMWLINIFLINVIIKDVFSKYKKYHFQESIKILSNTPLAPFVLSPKRSWLIF